MHEALHEHGRQVLPCVLDHAVALARTFKTEVVALHVVAKDAERDEAKEKLMPALLPQNQGKTKEEVAGSGQQRQREMENGGN